MSTSKRKPAAKKPVPTRAGEPTIESLRTDVTQLRGELLAERARTEALREALVWCSGASDFAPPDYSGAPEGGTPTHPGGKAREGWEKICRPLLAKGPSAPESPAAAAPEKPAPEAPAADTKAKAFWLSAEVRVDRATPQSPSPCVETDLRSYIGFLERKYGLTIHAIDYQKRPAGEHVKAVTTLGPEKVGGGDWFALAS